MKLHDRYPVPDTDPQVYIGHRHHRDRNTGKLKVSRKWHAEWSHDGRKFHRPLKTTNKAAAVRAVWAVVKSIQLGEEPERRQRVEWEQMRDSYISLLKNKGRSPLTLGKYTHTLTEFIRLMKQRGVSRPHMASVGDYWAFNAYMTDDGQSDKTRYGKLIIVKQLFRWAAKKALPRLLSSNRFEGEEVTEPDPTPQPFFTPEQITLLLNEADPHHEGPVIAVAAYLGLRFGEVRDLLWSDFDFTDPEGGWVTISKGGSNGTTKGKRSRRIPVHPKLRQILNRLPRHPDGRVFHQRPSRKYPDGGLLSERRLLKTLKRLCRRCGFENPERFKIHSFRHSFASMLARTNIAFAYALSWMGHQDSAILRLYYKFFDEHAKEAIKSVDYHAPDKPAA